MDKEVVLSGLFVAAILGVAIWFSDYRCSVKAEKMDAFDKSWGIVQGCMVKETPDSKWRDVQR